MWPRSAQRRNGTHLHQQQQPLDDESDGHIVGGVVLHRLQAALGEEVLPGPLEASVAVYGDAPTQQDVVVSSRLPAAWVLQRYKCNRDY